MKVVSIIIRVEQKPFPIVQFCSAKHSVDFCKLLHLQPIYKPHLQKTSKFTNSDLQQFTPDEAIHIYRMGIYKLF